MTPRSRTTCLSHYVFENKLKKDAFEQYFVISSDRDIFSHLGVFVILISDVAVGTALIQALLGCSCKIFNHPIMTTETLMLLFNKILDVVCFN